MGYDRRNYHSDNEDSSLKVKAIAALLSLVIGVVSRCESSADKARKPDLILDMVNTSEKICRVQNAADMQQPYAERLSGVLKDAFSDSMEVLNQQGVAVCLDARMANQNLGWFDKKIIGAYYPQSKVLAIYDNGKNIEKIFNVTATDYGRDMVEDVADFLKDENPPQETQFAARYSCGEDCTRTTWKPASKFAPGTLDKNPTFFVPPVHAIRAHD